MLNLDIAEAVAAEAVKQYKVYRRQICIWRSIAIASWAISIAAIVWRFV